MANFDQKLNEWEAVYNSLETLGFHKTAKSFCNAAIYKINNAISRLDNNQPQIHDYFVGASSQDLEAMEAKWRDNLRKVIK